PLVQQLLELADRAALEQHVPVGALLLGRLRLGARGVAEQSLAAAGGLPDGRDFRVSGERDHDDPAVGAVVDRLDSGGELDADLRLQAVRTDLHPSQGTLGHDLLLRARVDAWVCSTRTCGSTNHHPAVFHRGGEGGVKPCHPTWADLAPGRWPSLLPWR